MAPPHFQGAAHPADVAQEAIETGLYPHPLCDITGYHPNYFLVGFRGYAQFPPRKDRLLAKKRRQDWRRASRGLQGPPGASRPPGVSGPPGPGASRSFESLEVWLLTILRALRHCSRNLAGAFWAVQGPVNPVEQHHKVPAVWRGLQRPLRGLEGASGVCGGGPNPGVFS